MRKNTKLITLLIVVVFLVFAIGCAKEVVGFDNDVQKKGQGKEENSEEKNEDTVVLKIWSWYSYDETIKNFEEENEGIVVEQKLFGFGECEEAYMEAITKGEGPDVLILDSSFFGTFTASGILQDLLQEPFLAGKYENDFLGWESGFSANNELLALTINTSPYVALYRADIMKEYGFPYEPEEFGEFIKNQKTY